MAFKDLGELDGSDMSLWANAPAQAVFMAEIESLHKTALRKLVKKPTEDLAAVVRAYEKVSELMQNVKDLG